MRRLGMYREKSKGQWDCPAQETVIYGFVVNTVGPFGRGLVTISPGKVKDLQVVLAAMQAAEGRSLPDRFLAKVGGKLISVREAFAPAKLWSAEFFWALDMPNKLWWGAKVMVTPEMATSARFLQKALDLFNGTPIWLPHASILFRWDASGVVGWGAAVWLHPEDLEPAARAGGYWEGEMQTRHINDKEAQACLLGMLALRSFLQGQTVLPQGDSRTANAAIREFRGSMLSPFRTEVVRQIWLLSIDMGASLLPVECKYEGQRRRRPGESRARSRRLGDFGRRVGVGRGGVRPTRLGSVRLNGKSAVQTLHREAVSARVPLAAGSIAAVGGSQQPLLSPRIAAVEGAAAHSSVQGRGHGDSADISGAMVAATSGAIEGDWIYLLSRWRFEPAGQGMLNRGGCWALSSRASMQRSE